MRPHRPRQRFLRLSLLRCALGEGGEGAPGGGGAWHKASVSDCVPLAAPICPSPLLILTLCGPERVLVVSTEPPDDLSCLTTPGVGCPGDGAVARAVDQVHPDANSESMCGGAGGGRGSVSPAVTVSSNLPCWQRRSLWPAIAPGMWIMPTGARPVPLSIHNDQYPASGRPSPTCGPPGPTRGVRRGARCPGKGHRASATHYPNASGTCSLRTPSRYAE